MPKKFHTVLYSLEQIQLLKADEHHLGAKEQFLLQLLQDAVAEIRVLKEHLRVLELKLDKCTGDCQVLS